MDRRDFVKNVGWGCLSGGALLSAGSARAAVDGGWATGPLLLHTNLPVTSQTPVQLECWVHCKLWPSLTRQIVLALELLVKDLFQEHVRQQEIRHQSQLRALESAHPSRVRVLPSSVRLAVTAAADRAARGLAQKHPEIAGLIDSFERSRASLRNP